MSFGRMPKTTCLPAWSAKWVDLSAGTSILKAPVSITMWPSARSSFASKKFMAGEPMKPATKMLVGWSYKFWGESSCCSTPSFITAMRSAMVMASTWSCVT